MIAVLLNCDSIVFENIRKQHFAPSSVTCNLLLSNVSHDCSLSHFRQKFLAQLNSKFDLLSKTLLTKTRILKIEFREKLCLFTLDFIDSFVYSLIPISFPSFLVCFLQLLRLNESDFNFLALEEWGIYDRETLKEMVCDSNQQLTNKGREKLRWYQSWINKINPHLFLSMLLTSSLFHPTLCYHALWLLPSSSIRLPNHVRGINNSKG